MQEKYDIANEVLTIALGGGAAGKVQTQDLVSTSSTVVSLHVIRSNGASAEL